MRDFPSCFGDNAVRIHDSYPSAKTSKSSATMVTCVYQCRRLNQTCFITVTWSRTIMGVILTLAIDESARVDVKLWLFTRRKGWKILEAGSRTIDIFWDFSSARFGSGPEPLEGFYVAVSINAQAALLLGDMREEAFEKTGAVRGVLNAAFIARRENVFGKKVFATRTRFGEDGAVHDIAVECDAAGGMEPSLKLRVDRKVVMQVKRLQWKFRGNFTMFVDGTTVEFFWDVHNWLFKAPEANAIFKLVAYGLPSSFSLVLYAWKNG